VDKLFCLEFGEKNMVANLEQFGITFTTKIEEPPTLVYKRGIWFDGDFGITVNGLLYNPNFTVSMWVRIKSARSALYTIHDT
jgi:hypothetical protein